MDIEYVVWTEVLRILYMVSVYCISSDISINFTLSVCFLKNLQLSRWYHSSSHERACVAVILILQWEEV